MSCSVDSLPTLWLDGRVRVVPLYFLREVRALQMARTSMVSPRNAEPARAAALCFVLLLLSAEGIAVTNAVHASRGIRAAVRAPEPSAAAAEDVFVELSADEKLEVVERQWEIVRDSAQYALALLSESEGRGPPVKDADAIEAGISPHSLTGPNRYGTPRDLSKEGQDTQRDKAVCGCMVDELLFGFTGGIIPYSPNYGSKKYSQCFSFDAGWHATPLWYKKVGRQWYWTPWKPDSLNWDDHCGKPQSDVDDWMPTSTFHVKPGLTSLMQKAGLTDVADANKFLMKLINDYNPSSKTVAPKGSTKDAMDVKKDLRVCASRSRLKPGPDMCAVRKSGCMTNVVTRYFQFAEMQLALKKSNDRFRRVLDYTSVALDLLGMIEPYGFAFDLINAGLSLARNHKLEALLSLLAAIPGLGWWFAGIKANSKLLARVVEVAPLIWKNIARLGKDLRMKSDMGLKMALPWFKAVMRALGTVAKMAKAGIKLAKQYSLLVRATTGALEKMVKLGTNTAKRVKTLAVEFVHKFRGTLDDLFDNVDKSLMESYCMVTKVLMDPANFVDSVAKMMEFTGITIVKEAGEILQALVPCLKYRCGKKADDWYHCGLFVAFESFKKVAAIVDPDFLEKIGEYDPCMFDEEICSNGGFQKSKTIGPKKADAPPSEASQCSMAIDISGGGDSESGLFEFSPYKGLDWLQRHAHDQHGVPYYLQRDPKPLNSGGNVLPPLLNPGGVLLSDNQKPIANALPVIGKPCDTKNKHGRKWRGVDVSEIGTCLRDDDLEGCNGGTFISGYCKSAPSNVRCCVNQIGKPCDSENKHGVQWKGLDVSEVGTCQRQTDAASCDDGEFITGYCRSAPRNVKCCVKTRT